MASLTYRNRRRAAQLKRLANMRAAKKRKHDSTLRDYEPRMVKACRYQIKVRDTITGEVSEWVDLESARWAMRLATALQARE